MGSNNQYLPFFGLYSLASIREGFNRPRRFFRRDDVEVVRTDRLVPDEGIGSTVEEKEGIRDKVDKVDKVGGTWKELEGEGGTEMEEKTVCE